MSVTDHARPSPSPGHAGLFSSVGRFAVRRRRLILALTGAFVVVSAILGTGVFGALKSGGFEDPGAESTRAAQLLEERFGQGDPNVVLLATATSGDVAEDTTAAAGEALADRLRADGVANVVTYWSIGGPQVPPNPLASTDGDTRACSRSPSR